MVAHAEAARHAMRESLCNVDYACSEAKRLNFPCVDLSEYTVSLI